MDLDNIVPTVITLVVIGFAIAISILVAVGVQDGTLQISSENTTESFVMLANGSTQQLTTVEEGVTSSSATAHNNSWLEFDGVNDVVKISDSINANLSNGYTISLWINAKSSNITGGDGIYLHFLNKTGSRPDYLIGIRDVSGVAQIKFRSIINGSGCDDTATSKGFAKNNREWIYVTGVFNGTTNKLYINSLLNDTDNLPDYCTQLISETISDNLNIGIGGRYTEASYVEGSIEEVRIYNKSLTDSEISEIYNSGRIANSSLPSTGLVAWYSFNEATGNVVYDKSGNNNHGS